MPYSTEFLGNVQTFMRKYTLYLPGTTTDGGQAEWNDPAYAQHFQGGGTVPVPAAPVWAAWRPGPMRHHLSLLLYTSRSYKMRHTGRTQADLSAPYGSNATIATRGAYETKRDDMTKVLAKTGLSPDGVKAERRRLLLEAGLKVDPAEWFECYFLPWHSGKSLEMTLGPAADRFFTATMNGCAFHVSGNRQAPVVRHLNDSRAGDMDNPPTQHEHQQRYAGLVGAANAGGAVVSKYQVPGFGGANQTYGQSTAEASRTAKMGAMDMLTMLVGERDPATGNWSFFYQRAASVMSTVRQSVLTNDMIRTTPQGLRQRVRALRGKGHWATASLEKESQKVSRPVHHTFTPCVRVNF